MTETQQRDDLAAALDGFWLTVAREGRRVHGQIANPDEVADVVYATLSRIAAERRPDMAEVLHRDSAITCAAVIFTGHEDEDTYRCDAVSRFLVSRSDGDDSYGINGGSDESCEKHLAETVAGMIDGDVAVTAIVTVRWDM